jgi:hypothetical protein
VKGGDWGWGEVFEGLRVLVVLAMWVAIALLVSSKVDCRSTAERQRQAEGWR